MAIHVKSSDHAHALDTHAVLRVDADHVDTCTEMAHVKRLGVVVCLGVIDHLAEFVDHGEA